MKSIKRKVWFSILGVTAVVIGCLWFFQVLLLDKFYLAGKQREMMDSTKEIVSIIGDQESDSMQVELVRICAERNLCIELYDMYTRSRLQFTPRGSSNLLDSNFDRARIYIQLQANGYDSYVEETHYSEYNREFSLIATNQTLGSGGYILMVASELAPVQEAVQTIRSQLILLSIGLILLASLAATILARYLTKSILQISHAAREVAKGNLEITVDVRSGDELGMLAEDFNLMTREISRVNQLQRELVANVSHDIRTPLTMIKGYAEIIRDLTGNNPEKREQQLEIIIDESDRLNGLANDILDLSKLQAGQQKLTYASFDLGVKLRDIIRRYDLLTESEGFAFSLEAPEHLIVWADEIKMEQVLYNILNNAVNHTGEDKHIVVKLTDRGNTAKVSIIDTGAGIHPEDLPLIWDRYYKPYKKSDRKGMGTGLGLSIVKAILVAHQVDYGVDSTLEKGTTFWFEMQKLPPQLPESAE